MPIPFSTTFGTLSLIYHLNNKKAVDLGICIDPGFDFVRNLFHTGFSLDDIDVVLISHAHLDHIRDFESIVTLLFELKKKRKQVRRIHVILSLGAYKRLEHIVEHPTLRYLIEPYIIDINREIDDKYFENLGNEEAQGFQFTCTQEDENEGNIPEVPLDRIKTVLPDEEVKPDRNLMNIKPTRAFHSDQTYSDSFGFLIELSHPGKSKRNNLVFGYTGDTRWIYPELPDPLEKRQRIIPDIATQYRECDVLLVHLGSLIEMNKHEFPEYVKESLLCEELIRNKEHPYLVGMIRLLTRLYEFNCKSEDNAPLVLISEFGEELRGSIRIDFVNRLQKVYENRLAFLPVDVGLNIFLLSKKDKIQSQIGSNRCASRVFCSYCQKDIGIGDAGFRLFGNDHALYCICKTCCAAVPDNLLSATLEKLYNNGIDVRNAL